MQEATTASPAVEFQACGYTTIPRLLEPQQVEELTQHLERISGRTRGDFHGARPGAWTQPDGVTRHREFWPIIFNQRLLATVRALLGSDIRFLQHNDLHVGFSSFNWHRDSVSRTLGVGPDWDEREEPYRLVRVGVYLQSQADSEFKLGLIPGTHRAADARAQQARRQIERSACWTSHLIRALTGRNPKVEGAEWVSAGSGDCVIFDPRVLHTGTPTDGPKYSLFVAYGVPNRHYHNHQRYYRYLRQDLGYAPMPAELIEQLQAAGLYQETAPEDVKEATLPSVLEMLLARRQRRFRKR